jgi:hypothetical protein
MYGSDERAGFSAGAAWAAGFGIVGIGTGLVTPCAANSGRSLTVPRGDGMGGGGSGGGGAVGGSGSASDGGRWATTVAGCSRGGG